MNTIIIILQAIISLSLITLILMQAKGVGLGKTFGGTGEFYKNRRGVEKIVFRATIGITVLFFFISLLSLII